MDAGQIHRLVRACDGKAFFRQGAEEILVHRASELPMDRQTAATGVTAPGTVVDLVDGWPVVAVQGGLLKLERCTTREGSDVTCFRGRVLTEDGEGHR